MSKTDKELAVDLTIANLRHLETFKGKEPLKSESIAGLYDYYLKIISSNSSQD